MKFFMIILLSLVSTFLRADFLDCGIKEIANIHVQGDRDDNHIHNNSLVIKFHDSNCNNRNHVYIEVEHPLFPSMVSTALAAKTAGIPLRFYVNTSKTRGSATQISVLSVN